ncbi:MAG: hypothetical protein GY711_28555 [bacterium]|nr:hypothetical protein [bacterium]
MNDLRLWILTLATVSFFAGVAGGVIVSQGSEPAEQAPFADFERRFAREFGISGKRLEHLRTILTNYQRQVKQVEERHLAATYRDMDDDLNRLGILYGHRIRDKVLSKPDQRVRYDELVAGLPFQSTPNR